MRRMDAGVLRLVFIEGLLSAKSGHEKSQISTHETLHSGCHSNFQNDGVEAKFG